MLVWFVFLFLALPVVELWATIQVAGAIGVLATIALLMAMSAAGVWLLRRQGASVWRQVNAELVAGRMPTKALLDGALVLVGGVCLVVPGFVTGAFGALLMLPPVRMLVRPLLLAWLGARAARAARSGRMRAVFVGSTMGPDGRVHTRSTRVGDVIDAEGWDVGGGLDELPGAHVDGPHVDGPVVDAAVVDDPDDSDGDAERPRG